MAHLTLQSATWDAADTLLGSRPSRRIGHNTTLHRRSADCFAVRYWNTDIVTMHRDGAVTVDVHGWTTVTTLQRVNALLPDGWRIGSHGKHGHWLFAAGWTPVTPYADGGLTVRPATGAVEYPWGTPLLSADDVTAIRDAAETATAEREAKRLARYADQHHRLRYAGGIVLRSADGFRHRWDCPQCTALRERERAETRARLSAEHDAMAATLARNPTDAEPWSDAEYTAAGAHVSRAWQSGAIARIGCPWDCPQRNGDAY